MFFAGCQRIKPDIKTGISMEDGHMELNHNKEKLDNYRKRAAELVGKMTLEEKVAQTLYQAPAVERLNIKAYNWWNEALHGVARAGTATVFPQRSVWLQLLTKIC